MARLGAEYIEERNPEPLLCATDLMLDSNQCSRVNASIQCHEQSALSAKHSRWPMGMKFAALRMI